MKNLISLIIGVLFSGLLMAQKTSLSSSESSATKEPRLKNEIRFNIGTAIAGLPELNYETFVADNVGIGMAVAVSLESTENMELRSMFLPFARIYFSDKPNAGFFIEGNVGFVGQKGSHFDIFSSTSTGVKSYFNGGFGAAVGWKFLTRNNFVGEFYGGVGRLFGDNLLGAYPRVGITLGKRF